MISFDDAQALIATSVQPLGVEMVSIFEAAGRVLAKAVSAPGDMPPCATSAMDGYAVIDASISPDADVRLAGSSYAGSSAGGILRPGEAVRIFTGAPLPDGADRVIMQEYAQETDGLVRFRTGYGPGWHVRPQGSDFRKGDELVAAGTRLNPRALVAAAAGDLGELCVFRRPHVAILSTGDELVPVGQAADVPGRIPESISHGLAALVRNKGGKVIDRHIVPDDLAALERTASHALDAADLVIVTGGASVGERDYAKAMFAPYGMTLVFDKVAIKPGKPVWLGKARGRWILGLPGNPTSAMVTARLFLSPLLAMLQGDDAGAQLEWFRLPVSGPRPKTGPRETFMRATLVADHLVLASNQDSAAQSVLAQADWLVRCPAMEAAEGDRDMCALRF